MDNGKPLVSIYCMTYNHSKFIRQTFEAFVNQKTDFKFEVIVHDDASTDGTSDIVREYAEKYPDIFVPIIQTENQYSKKISIRETFVVPKVRGEFVAYCEGDDYWTDPNKLQMQIDILRKNPDCAACCHQTLILNEQNKTETLLSSKDKDYIITLKDVIARGSNAYHTSSVVMRAEYFKSPPAFMKAVKGVGDYPTSIILALNGGIYYINKCMSVYRLFSSEHAWSYKNNNSNTQKRIEQTKNIIKMLSMANDYSEHKYNDLFESVINNYRYELEKVKHSAKPFTDRSFRALFKKESSKDKAVIILKAFVPNFLIDKLRAKRKNVGDKQFDAS